MTLIPTSLPAIEPVSLAEAKAHLRVDGSDEDGLIAGLVTAARLHLEHTLGRAFITQGWSLLLDTWPDGHAVTLPRAPVQSITLVRTFAADDTPAILAPTLYLLDGLGQPPRLVRRTASPWPQPGRTANGIEIAFTAGHGSLAAEVPQPLRQAILLLVAHWFEQRAAATPDVLAPLPQGLMDLLTPFRRRRL